MKVFLGKQETGFKKLMLVGISLIFILLSENRVYAACNLPDFRCQSGSSVSGCFQCDHEYDCPDQSDENDCAQVDYSMALLWTSKDSTSGRGTLDLLYGDLDVYLEQMQATQSFNTSYYQRQYTLLDFTTSCDSVEVDYDKSNVVWSDQAYERIDISPSFYNGSKSSDFYHLFAPPVSSQVTGLSFDWVSTLMYWSDAGYQRIAVYDASILFPSWWRPVVNTNLTSPQDIVIYPNQSYLFWIDLDISSKIERFDLVNEIRKVLVTDGTIQRPTKLAIDFTSDRLYWLDSNKQTIGSCNLDGSDVSLWQLSLFSTISAFTFYRQYIFLGDNTRGLIHAFNKTRYQVLSNIQLQYSEKGINDFATYDPSKQISIQSPCTISKGGCSHFCIKINATARKCQCAIGFFLDSDGISCVTRPFQDKFLLVTDTWSSRIFQVDLATGEVRAVTDIEVCLPTAADYDYVSRNVYWFDKDNNGTIIRQTSLTNGVTRIFVDSVAAEITSLAVDTVGRNLYYTSYFAGTIGVISLSTRDDRKILAEPGSRPRVLVLDIYNRSLYWSDCGTRSIEKAQISNLSDHQSIVTQLAFCVSALAIDALNDVIYWGDQGGHIGKSKLDGSASSNIYFDSSANYTGMTTDDNYLYVADNSMRQLIKMDRKSNKIVGLIGNVFARPYALILYNNDSSGSSKTTPPTVVSTGGVSTTTIIIVVVVICGSVILIAVVVVVGILVARMIKRRKLLATSGGYDHIIANPLQLPKTDETYTELDDFPSPVDAETYTNLDGFSSPVDVETYTQLDDFSSPVDKMGTDHSSSYGGQIQSTDMDEYEEPIQTIASNRRSTIDNAYNHI